MTDQAPMLPATVVDTRLCFETKDGFEALQRAAKLFASSTLVPENYRSQVMTKNSDGDEVWKENLSGLSNCAIALDMSVRMHANPMAVIQNLHIIEGRPSWSSVFIIASINQCGRFSPLRFEMSEPGPEEKVPYTFTEWVPNPNKPGKKMPRETTGTMTIRPRTCRAWAIEKSTVQKLMGPEVSMYMAVEEGWLQKKGSKWRTMPEMMLRYRSASFFGKLYAPELLMGLQSLEELEDIEGEVIKDVSPGTVQQAPSSPAPAAASWAIEDLEQFEDLLDEAYGIFRAGGMAAQAETSFMAPYREKRAKGVDAKGLLRDLRTDLDGLRTTMPAVMDAEIVPISPEPAQTTPAPAITGGTEWLTKTMRKLVFSKAERAGFGVAVATRVLETLETLAEGRARDLYTSIAEDKPEGRDFFEATRFEIEGGAK